jgi:serine/threonine protein kinase
MSAAVGRTRVGRYELGRTLGEGTFGKVKFARNVETGENVAIKILDKEKVLRHKMIAQVIPLLFLFHLLCFSPLLVHVLFLPSEFLKDWSQDSSRVCSSIHDWFP